MGGRGLVRKPGRGNLYTMYVYMYMLSHLLGPGLDHFFAGIFFLFVKALAWKLATR